MESKLPLASVGFGVLMNASIVPWGRGRAAALRSFVVPISHLVGRGDSMCVGGVSS